MVARFAQGLFRVKSRLKAQMNTVGKLFGRICNRAQASLRVIYIFIGMMVILKITRIKLIHRNAPFTFYQANMIVPARPNEQKQRTPVSKDQS